MGHIQLYSETRLAEAPHTCFRIGGREERAWKSIPWPLKLCPRTSHATSAQGLVVKAGRVPQGEAVFLLQRERERAARFSPVILTHRERCDQLCLRAPSGVELGRTGHSVSVVSTADSEDWSSRAAQCAWGPARSSVEAWRVRAGALDSVPRRSFRVSDWK